eukprot:GFUD01011194.1.p1 GENE.GFUD01011194.1~~GFUD01011194.1.p1  ORF type:complete len:208 (-),score=19.25 GFUD01011194.1:183-806(-)
MLLILLLVLNTSASKYQYQLELCGHDKLVCPAKISGLTLDTCVEPGEPCGTGTWCPTEWYENWYGMTIPRLYCKETNKCYKQASVEHLACRNKENNCGSGEHFCLSTGGVCQPNSKTCDDFCEYCDPDFFEPEEHCIAVGYSFCSYTEQCQHQDLPCTDSCGYSLQRGGDTWYCPITDSCLSLQSPCDGRCAKSKPRLTLCKEEVVM